MTSTERWATKLGLVLAMAGSAVGLGNFLRFPVQAIQNGGGAFIIPYLVCFLVMGVPLLWVEWAMGRYAAQFHKHSVPNILALFHPHKIVPYLGVFSLFVNLLVMAYYTYIESWTLGFFYYSLTGAFENASLEQVSQFFQDYISLKRWDAILFWLITAGLNLYILGQGLQRGIERVALILMPLLIIFAIFLAIFALSMPKGYEGALHAGLYGFNFLWEPKFVSLLEPKVWLAAAGQIFFTLALGMGTIQCYASFMKPEEDIALNAMAAGWLNEFIEVVLGAAIIIPLCVGFLGIDKVTELTKSGGMGLSFRVLPYIFAQWGSWFGTFCAAIWFAALFFAGITSSLAMGLPITSFLHEQLNYTPQKSVSLLGMAILLLGAACVFSPVILDEFDFWAGSFALVCFAVIEVILFVKIWGSNHAWNEINKNALIQIPNIYKFILQWITPAFLLVILLANIPQLVVNLSTFTFETLIARALILFTFAFCIFAIYKSRNL